MGSTTVTSNRSPAAADGSSVRRTSRPRGLTLTVGPPHFFPELSDLTRANICKGSRWYRRRSVRASSHGLLKGSPNPERLRGVATTRNPPGRHEALGDDVDYTEASSSMLQSAPIRCSQASCGSIPAAVAQKTRQVGPAKKTLTAQCLLTSKTCALAVRKSAFFRKVPSFVCIRGTSS